MHQRPHVLASRTMPSLFAHPMLTHVRTDLHCCNVFCPAPYLCPFPHNNMRGNGRARLHRQEQRLCTRFLCSHRCIKARTTAKQAVHRYFFSSLQWGRRGRGGVDRARGPHPGASRGGVEGPGQGGGPPHPLPLLPYHAGVPGEAAGAVLQEANCAGRQGRCGHQGASRGTDVPTATCTLSPFHPIAWPASCPPPPREPLPLPEIPRCWSRCLTTHHQLRTTKSESSRGDHTDTAN